MTNPETPEQRVAREDLVRFINSCFACTGQREFYGEAGDQQLSIEFIHEYILGNYRSLYARTLAAGINHFNQQQIILNLLATGADTPPRFRREEGQLIERALQSLPVHRVFQLFQLLRERRVNNRRSRAVVQRFLAQRAELVHDAVKYRRKLRVSLRHAHSQLPGEVGAFLFGGRRVKSFKTPLFEDFRQAHFSQEAVYRLPYTIAEGLAEKLNIPRAEFLTRIAGQMTQTEQLRLQSSTEERARPAVDLSRAPLSKLALFILSLAEAERRAELARLTEALRASAERAFRRAPYRLGRVAAVLDRSYSSSGSSQKRRRALGVALGASALLRSAASEYRAFWTPRLAVTESGAAPTLSDELLVTPRGQTDLASPLLDALEWKAETVIIISDGFENSPPEAAAPLVRAYQTRIDPSGRTAIVHFNPVFDATDYAPKALGAPIPTLGLRDAEDVLTVLGFARFAAGLAPLAELEAYLAARERSFLGASAEAGRTEAGQPGELP